MLLLLGPLAFDPALLAFAMVALSMIVVTIFVLIQLLPRDGAAPLLSSMTIGLAVLGGGSVLLLALLYVFVNPDQTTAWTWVLLAFNFMMMGPAGLWFVSLVAFRDRRIDRRSWLWPVVLGIAVTGSEVMMGVLFSLAGGASNAGVLGALAGGLTSVWFDWSMAAVMASLVVWLPLHGVARGTLAALTAAALLAPWVTATPTAGAAGMALLMTVVFLLLYRFLSSRPGLAPSDLRSLLGLGGAFAVMVAAQATVVLVPASEIAALSFGSAMGLVMAAELTSVAHQTLAPAPTPVPSMWAGPRASPISHPGPVRER